MSTEGKPRWHGRFGEGPGQAPPAGPVAVGRVAGWDGGPEGGAA
jgi:hypothetical protein